jgi:hypothetical protein
MPDNILDLNSHKIKRGLVFESEFIIVDNFYKNPRKLKKWILSHDSEYHKSGESGYNGIYFDDKRHRIYHPNMNVVSNYISSLCRKDLSDTTKDYIVTNLFKFKKDPFNDYENNYWHPHKDTGYTGIIYFDRSDTNLYRCLDPTAEKNVDEIPEHQEPWKPKKYWQKIAALHGKFNRLILFDGSKFFHGADISSKKYMKTTRMNQVLFFPNV